MRRWRPSGNRAGNRICGSGWRGFDAAGGDAVQAGCADLGDQPVSPQFGDQTGSLVGSASGLPVIRGRGVEQLGLEVAVAEAGDGELSTAMNSTTVCASTGLK